MMTAAERIRLEMLQGRLRTLGDDDLLQVWDQVHGKRKDGTEGSADFRHARPLICETEAVRRFGLGRHLKELEAWRARRS